MQIAIVGHDHVAVRVGERLSKENFSVCHIDSGIAGLQRVLRARPQDVLLALSDSDERNLLTCTLAKQISDVRTIAMLQEPDYFLQKDFDLGRAFHVDHLLYPARLLADLIEQKLFHTGIYSENFFHGNVLLRTLKVPEKSSFCGKNLAQIRILAPELIVGIIHRDRRIVATSKDRAAEILGKDDQVIFAHGVDLVHAGDELTVLGGIEAIKELYKEFQIKPVTISTVSIAGLGVVADCLKANLRHKKMHVRDVNSAENIDQTHFFVACGHDEEHNFVLALRAKDNGAKRSLAVLSDKKTQEEAEKLGIDWVPNVSFSVADRILEQIQQGRISSVVSLYDARAEVLEVTISIESSIAGIPLSVLGPRLPQELLIGVIYSRGRVFIASGSHILKPHDEVILFSSSSHRAFIEKMF